MVGWLIQDICQFPQSKHAHPEEAEQPNLYILYISCGRETDMIIKFGVSCQEQQLGRWWYLIHISA